MPDGDVGKSGKGKGKNKVWKPPPQSSQEAVDRKHHDEQLKANQLKAKLMQRSVQSTNEKTKDDLAQELRKRLLASGIAPKPQAADGDSTPRTASSSAGAAPSTADGSGAAGAAKLAAGGAAGVRPAASPKAGPAASPGARPAASPKTAPAAAPGDKDKMARRLQRFGIETQGSTSPRALAPPALAAAQAPSSSAAAPPPGERPAAAAPGPPPATRAPPPPDTLPPQRLQRSSSPPQPAPPGGTLSAASGASAQPLGAAAAAADAPSSCRETAKKRPRLADGETEAWESEYKRLAGWMADKLCPWPLPSMSRQPLTRCTDEALEKLEAYLSSTSVA